MPVLEAGDETQLVPFDVSTLPMVPGAIKLRLGVVPPLDDIGSDAVTAVIVPPEPVAEIVWLGQTPETETPEPAIKFGVPVPVPPFKTGSVPVTFVAKFTKVVELVPVPPFAVGKMPVISDVRSITLEAI